MKNISRYFTAIFLSILLTFTSAPSMIGIEEIGTRDVMAACSVGTKTSNGNYYFPGVGTLTSAQYTALLGGVSLDEAAVFLDDMTDITGAYYDSTNGRIVFIGKTDTGLPTFDRDDLAVAIRSVVFNNTNPSMSIDAPQSMYGMMPVRYYGGIEDTSFGKSLFDADWMLKLHAKGYYQDGSKFYSSVPGYVSLLDRYAAYGPAPSSQGSIVRMWISPKDMVLKRDQSQSSFIFDQATMRVQWEAMSTNNDPVYNQASADFANHLTANYDQFAQTTPAFGEAKRLGKLVSVVKWIKDNNIATDYQWARDHTPAYVATPREVQSTPTPQVAGSNNTLIQMYGGVTYNSGNTYIVDSGASSSLKSASQQASSNEEDVHWTFSSGGQTYDSVAVSTEAFKSLGGFSTKATDVSIPISGNLNLEVTRNYSSFSDTESGVGRGWNMFPAKMRNLMPGAIKTCDGGATYTNFPLRLSVQLQDGTYETYTYDCAQGYLPDQENYYGKIIRDPSGFFTYISKSQNRYLFTSYLQLMRLADNRGHGMNYQSNSLGEINKIVADSGHTVNLAYDTNHRVTSITDWANRTVSYTYNSSGNLIAVTDPRGGITNYEYNTNHKLAKITDRLGKVITTNTYDQNSRVSTQKDSANNTTTFAYDTSQKKISNSDTGGRSGETYYDDQARILQQKDAKNNSIIYTYSGKHPTPVTVTDRRGKLLTNTLDSKGSLIQVKYPDNTTVSYEYNNNRQVTKITDNRYGASPKVTTNTYDSYGSLLSVNEAGRITTREYGSSGEIVKIINPLQQSTTFERDSLGNVIAERNANNAATSYSRDSLGRVTSKADPSNVTLSYTYDKNNNVLSETSVSGVKTIVYDAENKPTKTTSPDGAVTEYNYNDSQSLASVKEPSASLTSYGYDAYQNNTSRLDALNHTTQYSYDKLNQMTSTTTSAGKISAWEYDQNGNVTARIDALNQKTQYEYDDMNRLKKTIYPDLSTAAYSYDGRGNLTQVTDSAGTTNYTYDIYDRLIATSQPNNSSVNYQYDLNDNLKKLTYPDNKNVLYTYDHVGNLNSVTDWNQQVTSYEYRKNGSLKGMVLPNGISTKYQYSPSGKLSSIHHTNGGVSLARMEYGRDAVGRVITKSESIPSNVNRLSIYDESLATGWSDWSWSSTRNFTDQSDPYKGTKALKWTVDAAWAGLYLHSNTAVDTSGYKSLSFAAKATSDARDIYLSVYDVNGNATTQSKSLANYGGKPIKDEYVLYSIPLSDLVVSADKRISGISLNDNSGSAQPAMYLDSIELNNIPSNIPLQKVYTDTLSENWEDWSWGGVLSFSNTVTPFRGSKSISWTASSPYAAMYFHSLSGVNTTDYDAISFAMKGSQEMNPEMVVRLVDVNGNDVGAAVDVRKYGGAIETDAYKVFTLPLADFGVGTQVVSGFYIMNDSESGLAEIKVDDVYVIPKEPTTIVASTTNYTYDSLGRITSAAYPGNVTYSYSYDAVGNRITSSEAGTSRTYAYNSDNQLTAIGSQAITSNSNGNRLNDGINSYTFDYDNNLKTSTKLSTSQPTSYTYDSLGNRISKTTGGVTQYFVNDYSQELTQVLATKSSSGSIGDYYVYGLGLISEGGLARTDRKYYLDDGLGDVRLVAGHNGGNISYVSYGPFGNTLNTFSADYQFRGEGAEAESGLIYLRARYYDPRTGQFISKDPVAGIAEVPQSQNGFSYAHNDPVNLSDPSGEIVPILLWGIGAGLMAWSAYDVYEGVKTCNNEQAAWGAVGLLPGVGQISRIGKIANAISKGHAYTKHVGEFAHLGIKTQSQYGAHIQKVMDNPSAVRKLIGGRTAYFDARTGTVVINDPLRVDQGTAMIPWGDARYYFEKVLR